MWSIEGSRRVRSCCGSIIWRWRGRQVPYSGRGLGIWDLNLVGLDLNDLATVVLNFAMSFCISLA